MSIRLRDLRREELAWLATAERDLFGAGAWSEDLIRDDWHYGANRYRVIESEGEAAGYCIYGFDGDAFHLLNLAVLPNYRTRGLGRAALAEVIDQGRALGADAVWLEVAVDNQAAISLYRSEGFEDVRIRRKYYQPGDIDAIVMRLELSRFEPAR